MYDLIPDVEDCTAPSSGFRQTDTEMPFGFFSVCSVVFIGAISFHHGMFLPFLQPVEYLSPEQKPKIA